jgi:N-acetylneuraminic acid mutarotase
MNKKYVFGLLLLAFLVPQLVHALISSPQLIQKNSTAITRETDPSMASYGMVKNPTVRTVQERLQQLGYYQGALDGSYGKLTVRAVAAFQKARGIVGNGTVVDANTFTALTTTTQPEKILVLGGGPAATPGSDLNDIYATSDMNNWSLISPNNPTTTTKWSTRVDPGMVYMNNKFFLIGGGPGNCCGDMDRGDVWSSVDGVSWTKLTSTAPFLGRNVLHPVVLNGKIYIIETSSTSTITSGPRVWSSADGVAWALVTNSATFGQIQQPTPVSFNGKLYVIGGQQGSNTLTNVWSSVDGATWTKVSTTGPQTMQAHAYIYNGKLYVVGGYRSGSPTNSVWSSTDGVSWTLVTNALATQLNLNAASGTINGAVVAGGKMWIAAKSDNAASQKMYSSTNGAIWTPACTAVNWQWPSRTNFGMISNGGTPSTANPCTSQPQSMNTILFMGGGNEVGGYQSFNDVYNNLISGCFSTTGYSTSNGQPCTTISPTWNQISPSTTTTSKWSPRRNFQTIFYNNRYWVIGGETPTGLARDVWNSLDGVNWTQVATTVPFGNYTYYKSIVFNNKIYVVGGRSSTNSSAFAKAWSTTDGVTWTTTTLPFRDRENPTLGVYNSKLYVIGGVETTGATADVWSSSDGINWAQMQDFPFKTSTAKIVIYNNNMVFLGGVKWNTSGTSGGSTSTVYRYVPTSDTWSLTSSSLPTGSTMFTEMDAVVANNKIWIGNTASQSTSNRLWTSTDGGVTWISVADVLPWSPRHAYKMIAR